MKGNQVHATENKVPFCYCVQEANEYLKTVDGTHGLPEDEILATYQQLEKKEVTISMHGRHSCGKSTLLNALLDDRFVSSSWLSDRNIFMFMS